MKRYEKRQAEWCGMNWIRQDKRLAIYRRDGFRCIYCSGSDKLTLDHVVPHNDGGSNDASNLVTCCHSCNASRGKKSIASFAAEAAKRIVRALQSDLKVHRKEAKKLIVQYGSAAQAVLALAA